MYFKLQLSITGLFLILVIICKCRGHADFGYDGSIGPDHWANDLHYGTCEGKYQSPIDIEEHLVQRVRLPPLRFRGFHHVPISSTLTNNGHTVMLQMKTSNLVTISGGPLNGAYIFHQLHFHWGANDSMGSEDLINNQSFPMELHMVFYKLTYANIAEAQKHKDGLAVLAVFYESFEFENTVYSEIVHHLPSVTLPNTGVKLHLPMTLDSLLPANKYLYYTYNGSLTTPPCLEVVTWLDFKEPIPLSQSQIAAFRLLQSTDGMLTHNFRPVQPIGDRKVLYNIGERAVHWLDDTSSATISFSRLSFYLTLSIINLIIFSVR